jgi:hypothetical protein
MTSHLQIFSSAIKNGVIASCVLSLSLAQTSVALAGYTPPPEQSPPSGNTTSSGARGGCENNQERSLTVLAPIKHIGQTASVHPTFAWFIPDTKPFPIKFKLFELASDRNLKLVETIELVSSPGVMKLSLPKDKPGLVVGQRYLWQVTVLCNPNYPSSDLVARAEIQVVEMPPTLNRRLSSTTEQSERVELYAGAGLWYDAFREALGSAPNSSVGEVASRLLQNLANFEEAQQSANLSKVANSER